jgi:hypothetical protein
MNYWPSSNTRLEDEVKPATTAGAMPHQLVYSVYPNERRAAHAAQLLVEAGFPPAQVYIGVERNGELQRAHTGRRHFLGYGALVGASLSASIGAVLVMCAALGYIAMPLGPLAGLSALTASTLALTPAAIPGAVLGALVGLWRWNRGNPAFPAQERDNDAFVGVEVAPGNMFDAELTLSDAHCTEIARLDDWRALARESLHLDRAA